MCFSNRKNDKPQEKYKEIPFQHLAPIDTVEDKTTFDALDYALSQKNIHNIALTGNYGSGKSSILESYISKKGHFFLIDFLLKAIEKTQIYNWILEKCLSSKNEVSEKNQPSENGILENFGKRIALHYFLKISLATFSTENRENNTEQVDNEKNTEQVEKKELNKDKIEPAVPTENTKATFPETVLQKIEKSILQQILYRKSGVKLPNSRFIRIKRTNRKDAFFTAFVVIALFIVSNYFIHGKIWEYICKPFAIPLDWNDIALSVSLLLALFLFLYKLLIFVKKLRIAKLCFSNAEIEFKGSENEESLLNKYLDELLYFFEETEYNVVIFEDLDRFNNTEIFIKLRELNTLLNNYEKIHRKIVFVYALRDEVFTDNSRTKFFDFIVPVIPVINNQNSGDVLYNHWEKNQTSVFGKIDKNFLLDIGLYVDDMRLLKNSINEFKIYDKKINKEDYKADDKKTEEKNCRDRNKIFALILYKNLYPHDFALLAQNKGELYNIFEKKKDLADEEKNKIEEDIGKLEKEIKDSENQALFDIKELRLVYISKILSHKPADYYIAQNPYDYTSDEEFDKIQKETSLDCLVPNNSYYNNYSKGKFPYVFSKIEDEVDSRRKYKERENMVRNKAMNKIESLKKQLAEKKFFAKNIKQMSMAEMLEKISPEKFTAGLKVLRDDFVIYLLRNQYIDENYFDYISYFYDDSLSENDKRYLRLIKDRQPPLLGLNLNKVNVVLKKIKDIEWKVPAILNYSMLKYLLKENDSRLDYFLNTLWTYKRGGYGSLILSNFETSTSLCIELYRLLYKKIYFENDWPNILFDDEMPTILYNFFVYVDFEKKENIVNYIKKNASFLNVEDINKDSVSEKIKKYDLKFNLLEDSVNYPIYNVLLNNAAYVISKQNFDIIIKNGFTDAIEEPIKDYYTQISKLENQNVKTYVDQNIEAFVKDIVIPTGDSMAESEEAFVELLNNENLKTETKAELIEKNDCVVSDIARIKDTEIQLADGENKSIKIRNLLYKCKKVSPTWSNVFENFKYNGNKLDLCLVEYLNDDEVVKTVSKEKPLSTEELKEKSGNYNIVSTFYNVIMRTSTLSLNSFSKLMDACPWIYNSLGTYDVSPEKMDLLIKMDKLSFTKDNYLGIKQNYFNLLSKYISICFNDFLEKWSELKIKITFDDMKLFLDSDELNKEQKNRLLSSDFDAWYTVNQKDSLMWLGRKILELNFEGKIQVSIASVITNMDDTDDVLKLLCLQGRNLNKDEIIDVIDNKMDESYRLCIKREGKREKLSNTGLNKELCAILSAKGIISSYQEDGEKIKIIQKRM